VAQPIGLAVTGGGSAGDWGTPGCVLVCCRCTVSAEGRLKQPAELQLSSTFAIGAAGRRHVAASLTRTLSQCREPWAHPVHSYVACHGSRQAAVSRLTSGDSSEWVTLRVL
jgi:hypothetical protein